MSENICGPCSRGQHAPCDGQNEFWGDCTCSCNAPEPQGEPSDLSAHVEQVAYADDSYGTEDLPENYERHYCDEDGEDWPCAAIREPQGEPSDACDRDRMGICRRCGQGITAAEILDGENQCPGGVR